MIFAHRSRSRPTGLSRSRASAGNPAYWTGATIRRVSLAACLAMGLPTIPAEAGSGPSSPPASVVQTGSPADDSKWALLVFVEYEGSILPPLAASDVRTTTAETLSAALGDHGAEIVTYPELESTLRHWRVRSDRDLNHEFLHGLASEHAVGQVVVARLIVYQDRIIVLARGISPTTGHLVWADSQESVASTDLWAEPESAATRLEELLSAAARGLDPTRPPKQPGPDTVAVAVLPIVNLGLGSGPGQLAAHSLLEALLDSGRWTIPDPSLVIASLRSTGHDALGLDQDGRSELAGQIGASRILLPDLISFRYAAQTNSSPVPDSDDVEVSPALASRMPIYFRVLLVDCASGGVIAGGSVYLKPEPPLGLFGVGRRLQVIQRFREGASELVLSLTRGSRT